MTDNRHEDLVASAPGTGSAPEAKEPAGGIAFDARDAISSHDIPSGADVPDLPDASITLAPDPIESRLGTSVVRVPEETELCTGIMVNGHRIKSLAYSTDVAVIHNTNADAILAVYPFTGHPMITQAIMSVAKAPVFVGVGGGTTRGQRVVELAMFAEMQGVSGVVLNAPSPPDTVARVSSLIDIPVMATVLAFDDTTREKIAAGARIINVAAGVETAEVVRAMRQEYPNLAIVATAGGARESMLATIAAGANALTWTPPSARELQRAMMQRYRGESPSDDASHETRGGGEPSHRAGEEFESQRAQRLSEWLARHGM